MDTQVLYAHAIATLNPYEEGYAVAGGDQPDDLAFGATGLMDLLLECRESATCYEPSLSFEIGFELALQLGARIAESPDKYPDIADIMKEARARVRGLMADVRRGDCHRVCEHERNEAA